MGLLASSMAERHDEADLLTRLTAIFANRPIFDARFQRHDGISPTARHGPPHAATELSPRRRSPATTMASAYHPAYLFRKRQNATASSLA